MYKDLEQSVMLHLNRYGKAYTKPMYKQYQVKKQYNVSLNKFREMLFQMHLDGKIKYNCETDYTLPYWSKVEQEFIDKGGS